MAPFHVRPIPRATAAFALCLGFAAPAASRASDHAAEAPQEDDRLTAAAKTPKASAPAAATLPAPPTDADGVMLIAGADTRAAFAKGMPLYEGAAYKIHASRRDGPGGAEIHGRDTDIFYILEGTAMLVTGGTAVDPKTTAPDEIRAPSLAGGTARTVAKGDIIVIPHGVPHWFKEVPGPFLYYTVKVTAR